MASKYILTPGTATHPVVLTLALPSPTMRDMARIEMTLEEADILMEDLRNVITWARKGTWRP